MPNETPPVIGYQQEFDLEIVVEKEVDGVGMGVLNDGTPFLNIRGLARMCGVDSAVIVRITNNWDDESAKPREKRIKEIIREQGFDTSVAFFAVVKDGTVNHAIPSHVCMAILEYYAFESNQGSRDQALKSYRVLAKKGLNDFVFAQVGYNPSGSVDISWRQFHDRVSLTADSAPDGYFSIFREIASLIVPMINAGISVGPKIVPDISVGQRWGKKWTAENLESVYGMRLKFEHNYPDYFPQALSNPQHPWCYPDDALAEFRSWLKKEYLKDFFPTYLNGQVKLGKLPAPVGAKMIASTKSKKTLGKL
ncbi:hypothetical protein HKX54_13335 [Sulfitobacter sp. M57]|uniref:hypothetical protein n=1 Tax=unclassified Sulfitobacter TaxID=196795 RepID=UPI0023E18625|nr:MULTISPECIES: hypothetical protein [unclassified Sulfitobacter]MDF3415447.1 hypothetical protein [Sulfitobacter sp. KE5]MDF3422928.1 hypothetical protein [Sulfitobacter sp. KE43]MDF3433993.1 hypothetical protein [Sulfitobacter sp. KE42]MDF3459974.1 hypothetical protein [Sulfitobacter sp. S74]MDF3463532.1 hypothetical protein [Sulfitobacter sp. Ks18]